MEIEKFDQKEYIKEYNKKTYKQYKVYVRKDKAQEFDDLCKKNNLSKSKVFNDLVSNLLTANNISIK